MRRLFVLFSFTSVILHAQVDSFKAGKQSYVKPTIPTLGAFMTNVDSVFWNKSLLSQGFARLPLPQRIYMLEYKKTSDGYSEYIGFDSGYGVLTIIWTDESGKISLCKELRKVLKKNQYQVPGTYKTDYNGIPLIISLETRKEKSIHEMITVEIARK